MAVDMASEDCMETGEGYSEDVHGERIIIYV